MSQTRLGYGTLALAAAVLLTGCGGGASPAAVAKSATGVPAATSPAAATPAAATSAALTSAAAASAATSPAAATSAAATSAAAVSASQAAGSAASQGGLAAEYSQAAAALSAVAGQIDVSKQCGAIPIADVQALLKTPVGAPASLPLICGWKNTDVQVSLSPHDTDKKNYTDLLQTGGTAIAGLGDEAQWFEPVKGMTVPNVNAHKGSLTCYVQGAGDISKTTLPYTGSDPFFTITDADALAYASKEAKLCADVFSVS